MADDLQTLQQGTRPGADTVVRSGPPPAPAPGRVAPPRVPGKSIALPSAPPRKSGGLPWILLGMAIAALLAVASWGAWTFVPRDSGTIADDIPAEALAFLSVQQGSGALASSLVSVFTEAFGAPASLLGEHWTDAAYVLLPGGTPAEPIPLLLLRGNDVQPQVEGVTAVAVKNLPSGAVAIIDEKNAGRLDGLSGASLGRTRSFRALRKHTRPTSALLYLREDQAPSLLGPFSFFAPRVPDAVLLAMELPDATGSVVTLTGVGSVRRELPRGAAVGEAVLSRVPARVLTLAARPEVRADVEAWRVSQSGNPDLQEFFRALSQGGTSLDGLWQLLAGPYFGGSLPTSTASVRDGFLVMPLTEGTPSDAVMNALRPLEDVFRHADVFLTGSTFPDATFEEDSYNGVNIRYVNFGTPDRSFDYAVGDSLLLVATSRESMRLLIDTLKGSEEATLASDPVFQSLALPTRPATWQYLRVDAEAVQGLPQAWQPILSGFQGLVLVPEGTQAFSGTAALRGPAGGVDVPQPPEAASDG